MEKFMNFINKFSSLITSIAAAYYFVLVVLGYDLMYTILYRFGLGFLAWFVYIFVGLVGIYKLVETFKPEWIEAAVKKIGGKAKK